MGSMNSKNAEAMNEWRGDKETDKALQATAGTQLTALVAVGGQHERRQQKASLTGCRQRGLSNQSYKQSCVTRQSKALAAREPQAEPDVKPLNIEGELSSNADCYELRRVLQYPLASVCPANQGCVGGKKQFVRASNKKTVSNSRTTSETTQTSAVQNADAAANGCIVVKQEEERTNSPFEATSCLQLLAAVKPDPTNLTDVAYGNGANIKSLTPADSHIKTEATALSNSTKTTNCCVRLKKLSVVIKQENIEVLALSPKANRRRSNAGKPKISVKSPQRRVLRSHICGSNKPDKIQKQKYGTPINANKRRLFVQELFGSIRPPAQHNKNVRVRVQRIHSTKNNEAICTNSADKAPNVIITSTKVELSPSTSTRTTRNAKEANPKIAQTQNKTPLEWPTGIAHAQLLESMQPTVVIKRLNLNKLCQLESGGYLVSDALLLSCNDNSRHKSQCNTPLNVKLEKTAERLVYDNVRRRPVKRSVYRKIKQEVDAAVPIEVSATVDTELSIQRAFSLYPVVRLKRFKLPVKQESQVPALDCIKKEPPDVRLEHRTLGPCAVFVKQEEDSGISLDFEVSSNQSMISEAPPSAANAAACDFKQNVLVQIAAQRAYINAILLQNGYSPIQFKLYNDIEDLKIVLDYLLVK